MKIVFTVIFLINSFSLFAQESTIVIHDGKGGIIEQNSITLLARNGNMIVDSVSNTAFMLNNHNVYISAYDSHGDSLWTKDPWKDNNPNAGNVNHPKIVSMFLGTNEDHMFTSKKIETVLWVKYDNNQFAYLIFKTGKTFFCKKL